MNDDKYIPKHARFNDFNDINSSDKNIEFSNKQSDENDFYSEVKEEDITPTLNIINEKTSPEFELKKAIDPNDSNLELNIPLDDQKDKVDLIKTTENKVLEINPNNQKTSFSQEKKEINLSPNKNSTTDENMAKLWETAQFNQLKKSTVKKKRKIKKKVKKILWLCLLIFFIIIFIISISKLTKWNKDNQETTKIIENIQNAIDVVEIKDDENTELISSETEEKSSDYWYYTKFSLIDVDITKLKEKNKNTVGWINVNNTNINYPYVQYKDNDFYLNHSYDDTYNDAGWVFMDYRNNSNLDNKNTILYAHSRLDKTMFGSLSKTLKYDWYTNKDNHIIRISTETENSLWQIFSIYKIEEEAYYITTDFPTDESYQQFLDTIKGRSIYNFNTTLTTTDKILTLSTCYSDTIRTVVHAKLIKKSIK